MAVRRCLVPKQQSNEAAKKTGTGQTGWQNVRCAMLLVGVGTWLPGFYSSPPFPEDVPKTHRRVPW
jgi:hypothetical protein